MGAGDIGVETKPWLRSDQNDGARVQKNEISQMKLAK